MFSNRDTLSYHCDSGLGYKFHPVISYKVRYVPVQPTLASNKTLASFQYMMGSYFGGGANRVHEK